MKYLILLLIPGCCSQLCKEHKARVAGLNKYYKEQKIQVGTKGKPCARYLIDNRWVEVYDCGPNNEYSNYKGE